MVSRTPFTTAKAIQLLYCSSVIRLAVRYSGRTTTLILTLLTAFISIFLSSTVQSKETKLAVAQSELLKVTTQQHESHNWITIKTPGGSIEVTLASDITKQGEPIGPTRSFSIEEDIFLAFTSSSTERELLQVRYFIVDVDGYEPQGYRRKSLVVSSGEHNGFRLDPPRKGFKPGQYRVEVGRRGESPRAIDFIITSKFDRSRAEPVTKANLPPGYNIALSALGGRVEHVTSQKDDKQWAAKNLIDGRNCWGCGWSSSDNTLPQEIILSFHEQKEAAVAAVIIDPLVFVKSSWSLEWDTIKYSERTPQHVEVWVSTSSPELGFVQVSGVRLLQGLAQQLITLPAGVSAKFLKLVIKSNFGGKTTALGEIKVIEANSAQKSILADTRMNLARPELGGVLATFTSSRDEEKHSVHQLVDGDPNGTAWRSADDNLPQDFVFSFRGDQPALVDQVTLAMPENGSRDSWPKTVSVAVSDTNPWDGFENIATFELPQEPRAHSLAVHRKARFLKVRILENYGGPETTLSELAVVEKKAPDYTPLLLRPRGEWVDPALPKSDFDTLQLNALNEAEPNDSPDQMNPLRFEQFMRGTIDPLGENDYFSIARLPSSPKAITIELLGQPNIRTSLSIFDRDDQRLKTFDPGKVPKARTQFTWKLAGNEQYMRVSEPEVHVVLIWDDSGSMAGSTKDLEKAVLAYIDQVPPGQKINMIRFGLKGIEVLLDDFTADKQELKAATQGKFSALGGTPLYNALLRGRALLNGRSGNRAIVLMSDGADSGSVVHHTQFLRSLEQERVRLYAIGLGQRLQEFVPRFGTSGERILAHVALTTNGRMYFAEKSDELEASYRQIAKDLHQPSIYYLKPTVDGGSGRVEVVSIGEKMPRVTAPQVELILDASGSMRDRKNLVNGQLKIDIAKDVLRHVIEAMPDGTQVALRVYGRRIREGRKGDCQDTELIFPFAPVNKDLLIGKVDQIKALGTTPLAYALEQAALDFGDAPGEKIVVMITDGKEECGGDPQATIAALLKQGIDVRVNVVAFVLADEVAKQEMKDVAELTGGQFFDATNKDELTAALEEAMAAPFEVQDATGEVVASGVVGGMPVDVPDGIYKLVVKAVGSQVTVPEVRVHRGQSTRIALKKEGQEIGTTVTAQSQ